MMNKCKYFLALVLLLTIIPLHGVAQETASEASLQRLNHSNPDVRAREARQLGAVEAEWAVKPLIRQLDDQEDSVRKAAHQALKTITGKSLPANRSEWMKWWNEEGINQYTMGQTAVPAGGQGILGDMMTIIAFTSLGILILFIVLVFSIGGYKLKQMKEVIREAEEYVEEAEEVSKLTDRYAEEFEDKKVEMREFLSNLKEEKEGELERYTELLEENSAQRIREEISTLREQAEKEVEHTLQDLHEDVEVQIEREIKEVESDIEENLRELHEKFEREAEAQRLFLEASLLDLTEKFDEALDKYDDVLDMKPDHHLAIQRKARVLNRKGQSEMALKELQESLDHSPESPSLLYDIARTYALMSRKDRMLEFLEKSISIDDEYKDEALNDEAFKEFWDDRDFKDLAEA
jgi:tetratricopeptide (TPR) repeat protein